MKKLFEYTVFSFDMKNCFLKKRHILIVGSLLEFGVMAVHLPSVSSKGRRVRGLFVHRMSS